MRTFENFGAFGKFAVLLAVSTTAVGIAVATPAHAQASRTWVSGVGDDANPCSRTAPCKTFAGAISKTAALGEINCLDPGGYGAVTITKSITIDCHEVLASILNSGTNGVVINFDSFTDPRKTVRIRNINFNGVDTGLNGVRILGAAGAVGSEVFIEDCLIDGNFGGTATGITDERTGGGTLAVLNTTVRNVGVNGIRIPGAAARIDASFDNVRVHNSSFGIVAGTNVRMMITRSVVFGNTQAGIVGTGGNEIDIDHTVVSSNGIGVSGGGIVRLSNTDIAFNVTAVNGATQSFGNNRISGNTNAGTAPTPIGGVSNTFGQQ